MLLRCILVACSGRDKMGQGGAELLTLIYLFYFLKVTQ